MKQKVTGVMIIIILMVIIQSSLSYASNDNKVICIVINETNYDDLYSMDSVKTLIEDGAIALMNNRTSTRANTYKAYTTIGAGVRAEASSNSTNSMNITEEVKSIYFLRTGFDTDSNGIVNIDIARLMRQNENSEYGAVPGTLGQVLHDKGIKTAVIGNSDTDEINIRLGALIAMNHKGYVDYGDISKDILVKDKAYPFGLKSDFPKMLKSFEDVYNKAGLTVIDIGDISRLERYKDNLTNERYIQLKSVILNDIDQFLSSLLNKINFKNTRIIVISPYPSSLDIMNGNKLTPIILYGDGVNPGLLSSDTTRRPGIVANIDIAPYIAEYFKASRECMHGKPIYSIARMNQFKYLMNLNQQIVETSKNRYPVLSTFAIFEIVVSITALTLLLLEEKINKTFIYYFKNVLLSTMAIPFILLVLPLFKAQSLFIIYPLIISMTVFLIYVTQRLSNKALDHIIILSFITTFALLIDIVTDGHLIKSSLLGYDPIIGARYYGIGNEYMGVLIGSTLVLATALADRFRINKIWILFVFFVTMLTIGYPTLGANVGGTITAVAAFTFTSLRLFKIRLKFKQFILIGAIIVFIVALMAFIDMKFSKSQSHLAGTIQQILQSGPGVILMIIKRKISMNLRLIGITIWSKVLISTIIILAILFYRPVRMVYKLTMKYPSLSVGWTGIVMACIVGFLVNDSGVVAAATGIIFLAMSMLYLSFFTSKEND